MLSDADYNKMFTLQQASMEAPAPAPDDLPAKPYFTPDEDEPKPAPEKKPARIICRSRLRRLSKLSK